MLGPVEVCFPSEGVARWVRWQWVGVGSSLLEAKERGDLMGDLGQVHYYLYMNQHVTVLWLLL